MSTAIQEHRPITAEEQAKRQQAVSRARTNVRLEGTILPAEIEKINHLFIHGEISQDGYVRQSLEAADRLARKVPAPTP